jgi:aryl-alcohol dehydrogenase-like predicted oxidoreductase
MEYGNVGGLPPISRLVLGSMVCSPDDQVLTNDLLDAFVFAGGSCIDTAHIYGGGKSEQAIGEWFAQRRNRDKIVLLDKGAHHDSSGPRVTPEGIVADLTDSLERLQTDYIDLYMLHRDNPDVPVAPIVDCLNELQQSGKIRAFGGSNWTPERLQEANDYATKNKLKPFVASSPHLSLAVPSGPMWAGCVTLDASAKAWYQKHQLPVFAWSSQASGFFTGRYAPDVHTNGDVERIFYSDQNWERLRRAQETAEAHGMSANSIALAYVLHQPFPVYALIGPRTVEELQSSLAAIDVKLSGEEVRYLEA